MTYEYLLPLTEEELDAIHRAPGISAELTRRAMAKSEAIRVSGVMRRDFGWTSVLVALDRLFGHDERARSPEATRNAE
jgi:hypothetical protein